MKKKACWAPSTLTCILGRSPYFISNNLFEELSQYAIPVWNASCDGQMAADWYIQRVEICERQMWLMLCDRRGKVGGASHFTLRGGRRLSDGSYQAPCVAMVCSFHTTSSGLLSPDQAQTLFHEFGHALHSVLSRTEYQHHSGHSIQHALYKLVIKA